RFRLAVPVHLSICFSFSPAPTPPLYTLSLHDALPISPLIARRRSIQWSFCATNEFSKLLASLPPDSSERPLESSPINSALRPRVDRKSTRLNSSHVSISYAVFCLKKKKLFTPRSLGPQ